MWVCVLPREEAIRRIMEWDSKTAEEAERRLDSQIAQRELVGRANVVFCTQWAEEYTQKQVEKAWAALTAQLAQSNATTNNHTVSAPSKSHV